jgi:hypothetical protein
VTAAVAVDAGVAADAHCWERGIRTVDPDGSVTIRTPGVAAPHGGGTVMGLPPHIIAGLGRINGMFEEREVAGELIARAKALRGCLLQEPSVAAGAITAWCSFEIGADGRISDIEIRYQTLGSLNQLVGYVDMENGVVEVPGYLRPVHDCLLAELHAIEFPKPAPTDFPCTSMQFDPTARARGIFVNRDLY